jgi:hypothetical protein
MPISFLNTNNSGKISFINQNNGGGLSFSTATPIAPPGLENLIFDLDMANFSAPPVIGGSILTGLNQAIRLNTFPNSAFTYGTGDFTVEWWSNQFQTNGAQGIWRNSTNDALNSIGYWTINQPGGRISISIGNGTTTDVIQSNNVITVNTWNHFAFVRTGNLFKLYVNGVAQTSTLTSNINLPQQVGIMQIGNAGGNFYGRVTNFRIVKGTAVYTANFTPPTQPLKAISGTSLLILAENSSNFLIDSGPFAHTITNSAAAYDSMTPFTSVREATGNFTMLSSAPTYSSANSGSLIFNGTSDAILCTGTTTVTQATFLCWIRRNGTQGTYDGIMYSRGTNVTGINFYSSNQLGYNWNDSVNTYNWASGLTIPDLTWCMVAISVTSTSATAYLCQSSGITSATNNVSHTSTTLDDIKIGFDEAFSRYFAGNIAIAQLYTTALSAQEISQKFDEDKARFGY